MKRIFLILMVVCLLGLSAWSMIDSFFFKLKGEIISISSETLKNDLGTFINYSMKIKIIDIMPNKNASAADVGRARSRFKNNIDIQTVRSGNNIDVSQLKTGDIIMGDFEQIEVEMHPAGGYRITNSLTIEQKCGQFTFWDFILAPFIFIKNLIFH